MQGTWWFVAWAVGSCQHVCRLVCVYKGWGMHVGTYGHRCVPAHVRGGHAWMLTGTTVPVTPLLLCARRGTAAGWGWWWLPTCTTATSRPGERDTQSWGGPGPHC